MTSSTCRASEFRATSKSNLDVTNFVRAEVFCSTTISIWETFKNKGQLSTERYMPITVQIHLTQVAELISIPGKYPKSSYCSLQQPDHCHGLHFHRYIWQRPVNSLKAVTAQVEKFALLTVYPWWVW